MIHNEPAKFDLKLTRVKKILIRTTFKNTIFYGIYISRFFLRCYIAGGKRAGFSNPVKNRVLETIESCSNIFFALNEPLLVVSLQNFQVFVCKVTSSEG